jgi:hypothetical protein
LSRAAWLTGKPWRHFGAMDYVTVKNATEGETCSKIPIWLLVPIWPWRIMSCFNSKEIMTRCRCMLILMWTWELFADEWIWITASRC